MRKLLAACAATVGARAFRTSGTKKRKDFRYVKVGQTLEFYFIVIAVLETLCITSLC